MINKSLIWICCVLNCFLLLFQGVYVTYIHEGGPAERCGLQIHDKILQASHLIGLGNFL